MENITEHLKFGPIIYVHNLNEALKADKMNASAVYIKRKKILDINLIVDIKNNTNLKIICQCIPGNSLEAKILYNIGVDIIHESYVIKKKISKDSCKDKDNDNEKESTKEKSNVTIQNFLNKKQTSGIFMSSCNDLGSALRRIHSGFHILMIKPDDYIKIKEKIYEFFKYKNINSMIKFSKNETVPLDLVKKCSELNRIPIQVVGNTNPDNIFDIVNLKCYDFDNLTINSKILNDKVENLIQIADIMKDKNQDEADLIIKYYTPKDLYLASEINISNFDNAKLVEDSKSSDESEETSKSESVSKSSEYSGLDLSN